MARYSKFEKRIKPLLIDDIDIYFSLYNIKTQFSRLKLPEFKLIYKQQDIFKYPSKNNDERCYVYSGNISSITSFFDAYFSLKHDTSFNMTASEIINFYNTKYNTIFSDYFKEKIADDLLLILKICDKRTGRRTLNKIDKNYLPPILQEIVEYRLKEKKNG